MGYYQKRLSEQASNICTIILPWGTYRYKCLPMGVSNSPYIFRMKWTKCSTIRIYLSLHRQPIKITTKGDWFDHLEKLEPKLKKLKHNGLKCNIKNQFFGKTDMEYLGFWVTRNGILPINKKVEAIKIMTPPTNTKQARSFIGLLNYYRDMWPRRSHLLQPLTALTPSKVRFKWTEMEKKVFDDIKQYVAHDNLWSYPDFNNFLIYIRMLAIYI